MRPTYAGPVVLIGNALLTRLAVVLAVLRASVGIDTPAGNLPPRMGSECGAAQCRHGASWRAALWKGHG